MNEFKSFEEVGFKKTILDKYTCIYKKLRNNVSYFIHISVDEVRTGYIEGDHDVDRYDYLELIPMTLNIHDHRVISEIIEENWSKWNEEKNR